MITPKQFNNITERVVDDLKQILSSDSQVSIAAASFSIYAYEALKEELEKVDCVNFIFTSRHLTQTNQLSRNESFRFLNLVGNVICSALILRSGFEIN